MRLKVRKSSVKWIKGESCVSNPSISIHRDKKAANLSSFKLLNKEKISSIIDDFYHEINFSYDVSEYGLQSQEFRERLVKTIVVLKNDVVKKSFIDNPNEYLVSLLNLIKNSENISDEGLYHSLCFLLEIVLKNNMQIFNPHVPMLLKIMSQQIKLMLNRTNFLVHLIHLSGKILKSIIPFADTKIITHFAIDFIQLILNSPEKIKKEILIVAKNLNFSSMISVPELVKIIDNLLHTSSNNLSLNSVLDFITSLFDKNIDNLPYLRVIIDQLNGSDHKRKSALISSLYGTIERFFVSEINLIPLFEELLLVNIENIDEDILRQYLYILSKVVIVIQPQSNKCLISYMEVLFQSLFNPSYAVSSFSEESIYKLIKKHSISSKEELSNVLITLYSNTINKFSHNQNCQISVIGRCLYNLSIDYIDKKMLQESLISLIPNIVEYHRECSNLQVSSILKKLLILLSPIIDISILIQCFPFLKDDSLIPLSDLWIFEVVAELSCHINQLVFDKIVFLISYHYKESQQHFSTNQNDCCEKFVNIYRSIIKTLPVLFAGINAESISVDRCLQELFNIVNTDPSTQSDIIIALSKCNSNNIIVHHNWIIYVIEYYLQYSRKEKLENELKKVLRFLIKNTTTTQCDSYVDFIYQTLKDSDDLKQKQIYEIIIVFLPFLSIEYLREFTKKFIQKSNDMRTTKRNINKLTKISKAIHFNNNLSDYKILILKEIHSYMSPFLYKFESIYSSHILKYIRSVLTDNIISIKDVINFIILALYEPNTKKVKASRDIIAYYIQNNLFPFDCLNDIISKFSNPSLTFGSLEILLIILSEFGSKYMSFINMSIFNDFLLKFLNVKTFSDKKRSKLYMKIITELKQNFVNLMDPKTYQLLQNVKIDEMMSEIVKNSSVSNVKYSIERNRTKQIKNLKNVRKLIDEKMSHKRKPKYQFDFDENASHPTSLPQGIKLIKSNDLDKNDEFPTGIDGKMIIEEFSKHKIDQDCDNKEDVCRNVPRFSNKKKSKGDKTVGKMMPYAYVPLVGKSSKTVNKGKNIFKEIFNKRRNVK